MDQLLQQLLGYLNFSEGRPDTRFQQTLNETYLALTQTNNHNVWTTLASRLRSTLQELHESGAPAFRDVSQAEAALTTVIDHVIPAYRDFHKDLLFSLDDQELFRPFFLARVFEAVLLTEQYRDDPEKAVDPVLKRLNDYVGHRPVAILETRPKAEPYPHERLRPIPLFIQEAGVASGRYHDLISKTLEVLQATDDALLTDAFFDLDNLEEIALDPRAYDHGHPVNRRPNYIFGEWDPHLIDNRGFYRRFVLRKLTLDAILSRPDNPGDLPRDELLFEAASVLAGIMLMSTGISGSGPETHDSSVTLTNLIPRIARYRDTFYQNLLAKIEGSHGDRLRKEAEVTRQPFGGARQHLNLHLARHRAAQLQHRHLALLMADLGYPEASRRQADKIPAASMRLLSEIHIRLTLGKTYIEQGKLEEAAAFLPEIEDLLLRGIDCGALADPWNILGYGGLFPLFHAMEDSIRDPRIDELVEVLDDTFNLYAELSSEAAATGKNELSARLLKDMKKLAQWWDKFATTEVNDVQRVHGGEATSSAEHVAKALRLWRERGEATADLAFWRDHLEGFTSTKAFSLVVDALLKKEDYRAALGLLMNWLSQVEEVPLEDGEYSFHGLAIRWMLGICEAIFADQENLENSELQRQTSSEEEDIPQPENATEKFLENEPPPVVVKFFDYLEANAEDYWNIPDLELLGIPLEPTEDDFVEEEDSEPEEDNIFGAAYENMTYQDSTDDDVEAEVLDVGPEPEFDLELEGERIEKHLRFLSTVARLWNIAARATSDPDPDNKIIDEFHPLNRWLGQAKRNYRGLLKLLDTINDHPIPDPSGSYESLVEFDRRRVIKDRLLHAVIGTCLDTWLAMGALYGRCPSDEQRGWEADLTQLEEALWSNDSNAARAAVMSFLDSFRTEPLLFVPLSNGGNPKYVLQATRAQTILRALVANLPRLGLIKETHLTVQTAHEMERRQTLQGQRVTEFDRLFQTACQAAVEVVVHAANDDPGATDEKVVSLLERLIHPYLPLWREHSRTLRVAMLEVVSTEAEWEGLMNFIKEYGHDIFQVRFMSLGNLRGILHRGVNKYLDDLLEDPSAEPEMRLLDDLDSKIDRVDAERYLGITLQTIIENYDIYKDYNSTAPQSDYGENLYILLDFLRLKSGYERQAWQFRPIVHVHEILAKYRPTAAVAWQERFTNATRPMADFYLQRLEQLRSEYGIRLNTITDRLEERFVKTLALDRLCARIEPTMNAAGTSEADEALALFEEELKPYAETPTGVGLDIPQWLQRLDYSIHEAKAAKTEIAGLAENLLQIPKGELTLEELEEELHISATVSSSSNFWSWMTALLTPTNTASLPGPPPPKS
ncbi:MAG: hypothetical protein ACFCD0_19715 [Gemmataceae bacterium]